MKVNTVFLTNRDDISIEYLIDKYRNLSENYLRINSEDINLIDFQVVPDGCIKCFIDGLEFDLDNVKSVVFRRIPSKFNALNDGENQPYLTGERKHFLEGLFLSFENAKWINPMFATQIAERKLYQLKVAAKLGLSIPNSIVTNKLSIALDFLQQNKKSIIKPISNGLQILKDRAFSIYTTEITKKSFSELGLADIFDTPVFLQERIDNRADIRVTVVGDIVFPVAITNVNDEVDWRKPDIVKDYRSIVLPELLKEQLLTLNRFFGMVYSAIDLILTPDGRYVFLEINPVGEWVWLERELGLDISGELLKELL